jgi:hypothetical protein
MKRSKSREVMPVNVGVLAFDVTCFKCPKCAEEVYDEEQYSEVIQQVKGVIRPLSKNIVKQAQHMNVEVKLQFVGEKQKARLITPKIAVC